MPVTLSSADVLLAAAHRLTEEGQSLFSAETLIVEAWKALPEKFGMKGHPHPDTHRAMSYLCGARGLVGRGFLLRTPSGYSLAAKGLRQAERLTGQTTPSPRRTEEREAQPVPLPPEQDALLQKQFAVARRKRPLTEWTFAEACHWWGGVEAAVVDAAESMPVQLAEIARLLGGRRCLLSNGRETTADEVAELIELAQGLRQRFAAHLRLLTNRKAKAKS